MKLCIFEDDGFANLQPLSFFRPVYDLRCGINTVREKIMRSFPDLGVTLLCRDYLENVLKEENHDLTINSLPGDQYLFVNGRGLFDSKLASQIDMEQECVYTQDNVVIAAVVKEEHLKIIRERLGNVLTRDAFSDLPEKKISATVFNYSWDLIGQNDAQIEADFRYLNRGGVIDGDVFDPASLIERNNIYIAEGASIRPGAVLDAEEGPIIIDQGAEIFPQATIIGPAHIGRKSKIKIGAKIYEGTSIGEVCKVGGEVEESIIHSYSNKQHDGFLGHAYLGQWVNLGADTNNSDLKNNYGNVKVYVNGQLIDSGSMFVGSTIGDHSKTGINTMINTGTVIGVFSNVFGGGFPPKYIPSFSWGGADGIVEHAFDKAIDTANQVMKRRDKEVTPALEKLYRKVFEMTRSERGAFSK